MRAGVEKWAAREFEHATLGDWRRNVRAAKVASAMASSPGRSIPKVCGRWAATKGCYRMLSNRKITHAGLLEGHAVATIARARTRCEVVAIEDGTSLSFPADANIEGLGPISPSASTKGILVHSTLLLDGATGETLGVTGQEVWVRPERSQAKKERPDQRKKRDRESDAWAKGTEELVRKLERVALTCVMDREGDIYEALTRIRKAGAGFVIRGVHNRKLAEEIEGAAYSLDAASAGTVLGTCTVTVPRRAAIAERQATLTLRATPMRVLPPRNISRKGEPIALTVVVAREEDGAAPDGQRLNWVLLTDRTVLNRDDAIKVVNTYKLRWRIEEFHMGLKTGCGCEDVQFAECTTLQNYLALATVTAWRVLSLRDAARARMPLPADAISAVALELLKRFDPKLPTNPEAYDVMRAVARLGGFLSRKGDGEPGWRSIWSGYQRLREWEFAASLASGRSG
jgi:hypothetical protein